MTILNSKFIKGEAKEGGAIYSSFYSTLNIYGSTFEGNLAKSRGGAIYMQFSQLLDMK